MEDKMENKKSIKETIERLSATVKCLRYTVSGIDADCNRGNCDECELGYAQGTMGEHIEDLCTAILALQGQSIEVQEAYYRGVTDGIRKCNEKLCKVMEVISDDCSRNKGKN